MWLGGTHIAAGSNVSRVLALGGLARCWVLRRHLRCRVFLVDHFWPVWSNADVVFVVAVVVGQNVVVC